MCGSSYDFFDYNHQISTKIFIKINDLRGIYVKCAVLRVEYAYIDAEISSIYRV